MKRKKAYIYTRVSTTMQVEGFSLDAQEAKIQQYANAFDIEIAKTYQDAGKSGKTMLGRTEFMAMISDIEAEKDKVDYVLVFKLSRFGRNAADTLKSLAIMESHGVNLICVDDGLDSSKDSGKLVITILSAVAEMERENIISQAMEGRRQKARAGQWNGGFAPVGYSLVNGQLQVNQEEAESVKMIFDLFANSDMGTIAIAKHLANLDIKKPIRHNSTLPYFSSSGIARILDNPVYNGKIAFGRRESTRDKVSGETKVKQSENYILTDGIHEAIIDDETWNKVRKKREANAHKYKRENPSKGDSIYVLSGLIKCPLCNAGLYGNKSIKRNKNKKDEYYKNYYYYACKHRNHVDGHKCTFNKQLKTGNLDHEVLSIISKLVSRPGFARKLQEKINIQVDTSRIDSEIEQYKSLFRQLNATKMNLIQQIDSLNFEDPHFHQKSIDLDMRLNTIYDKLADVETLIETSESKREVILKDKMTADNIYKILVNFASFMDVMEDIDKKRLCQMLIEKVEIYDEKNEAGRWVKAIHFKLPIIEEDLEISLDNSTPVEAVVKLSKK
ncbi:TPA: recombinase family protein [Streptococcus suis]|nr:recombinase family protein [Streptococcus suis]HEM6426407.1 recombinase family protein [Streptococcus suis]